MLVRAVESTMVSYSVPTCSVQKCCKEFVQRVTKFQLPVNQQKYRFTQMKNFLFKKLLYECLFWGGGCRHHPDDDCWNNNNKDSRGHDKRDIQHWVRHKDHDQR